MRLGQSFAQFEIENLKPQLLGATQFFCASRQSRHVLWPPGFRRRGRLFALISMFNGVLQ